MTGKLIITEGLDGTGKTTFIEKFIQKYPYFVYRKLPSKYVYDLIPKVKPEQMHNIFHTDIDSTTRMIQKYLNQDIDIILDRYIYSHFVYEKVTTGIECKFDNVLAADLIIYFRVNDINKLRKQDVMENRMDYSKGQQEFDKIFKPMKNVLTVKALEWDVENDIINTCKTLGIV